MGVKSQKVKLSGQEKKIKELLDKKISHSAIARLLNIHRLTVAKFIKERMDENGKLIPVNLPYQDDILRLEDYVEDIRDSFLKGQPMYEIAKEYGVKKAAISHILRN